MNTQVSLEKKALSANDLVATELRTEFAKYGILAVNLISSPGAGKTLLLERTLERFHPQKRVVLLTGDIQTKNDATRLERAGFPVKQIVTGGTCHLDATMIKKHLAGWPYETFDLLIIENVGNLACPSSFDLGEYAKVVLLSVTEGEDKPLKYPSIFAKAKLMILSKIDLLPHLSIDAEAIKANARLVNPSMQIIETSAVTGEGLEDWITWLKHCALNCSGSSL
jgi:hydrogenase nickel incorporation protein HypB